ncbi:hypothetical protein AAFF_G00410790 [Aldrovandia affinis]|uniref:Uncharacterized protein n=1 Tax=Aldrovandia affinis TaxID=143900 RepID=A0AAD7VYD4_9TELE|nr:hypothetical protein AAFF_G00410790 [Aldrovandia affinis]
MVQRYSMDTLLYEEDFEDKEQNVYERMPWLEFWGKGKDYNTRPSPRLFCSQLQQHLVPRGLQEKKAKSPFPDASKFSSFRELLEVCTDPSYRGYSRRRSDHLIIVNS